MRQLLDHCSRTFLAGSLVFVALAALAIPQEARADRRVDPDVCNCHEVEYSGSPCLKNILPTPPLTLTEECFLLETYCSLADGSGDDLVCFQRSMP